MKKITVFLGLILCVALSFAQENPCANILSHGIIQVSNNGNNSCTSKVFVNASGNVPTQKGLRVQVYIGSISGTLLKDMCFVIPGNTVSNYYETDVFSAPCDATIVYVVSRYTSSNGSCSGGSCSITISAPPTPGSLLPIKMSSFYAKRKNSVVELNWTTETEINAKEFIVQRKSGNDFIDISKIAATNKASGSAYVYKDVNNVKGVTQYRLKMIDQDGAFKYSEIRTVKGTTATTDFTIFPNPSTGSAKITITDISEPTDVQLIDNSGRILKVVSMNNSNTADFNSLQKGMYMIRILNKTSGETQTKKLNVVN